MATEIEQRQSDDSANEIKAPILEELENDRELVQRAVNGELKARRTIAEIIDPLVNRKSTGLCKRYCGRNRLHSRCTVDRSWGQTLFYGERDNIRAIAMFWPWSNGQHTTLKLAVLPPK